VTVFAVSQFCGRCDYHANTLTVILDTTGNIFGGFSPVAWESRDKSTAGDNPKSLLFTLKTPHNIGARRFLVLAEKMGHALWCHSLDPSLRHE
jgi:hypothetical protein